MKVTPRFTIRAALAVAVAGVIGAIGACGKDSTPPVIPPPPPPPLAAPTNLSATAASATKINLTWAETDTSETGFQVDRCSGVGCSNFAQVFMAAANAVAYSDSNLTASTSYSYRVRAVNATQSSAWSTTTTALTLAVTPPAASPIFVGAGEITTCGSTASMATGTLVQGMLSDTNVSVFTAGNNLADTVPGTTYQTCFEPKWGSFKDRTWFSIGNGDFDGGRGAAGVYSYLGNRTGPVDKGWFSFDKGNWHIIVLNTSDWQWGSAKFDASGSEEVLWLNADLAANTKPCIMAISWERRLYTSGSGTLGRNSNMNPIVTALYGAGADILISAKDKLYARFPQSTPDGVADAAQGFRQFIVGTGGRSFDALHTPAGSTVEVQQNTVWGVLKLTLNQASYTWDFVPTVAGAFTDTGTTSCH